MALTTRSSLLDRLRDENRSFDEFARLYTPLLTRFAQQHGLQGQDVDEVVQGVLVDFFNARKEFTYDRSKGRFRSYLKKAVTSRVSKLMREARRIGTLNKNLSEPTIESEIEDRWEKEYEQHLLQQALALVRTQVEPQTYQAFDLYVLQNVEAKQVAQFLGVSTQTVYNSKHRVEERLKELVKGLREE